MNCVKCGAEIPKEATSCPSCGAAKPVKQSSGKKILVKIASFALAAVVVAGVRFGADELKNKAEDAKLTKTYQEIDTMIAQLPIVVTDYKLGQWQDSTGSGPLLQPVLQNKGDKTITQIELAVATWDAMGMTVNVTFDDGDHSTTNVAKVTYEDCDFVVGGTYGTDIGLALNKTSKVPERIQAVPVSWTYEDGTTEENPYYKYWLHKYQDHANTRADLAQTQFTALVLDLTKEELAAELNKQPLVVTDCAIAQWEQGDLLCATVKNNGEATVKSMLLAFATFDEEGNPVCITWSDGEKAESNVIKIRMKDLALAYGGEYGSDKGVGLHAESDKVASFQALPYYYEDIDGNTWENPLYDTWLALYAAE